MDPVSLAAWRDVLSDIGHRVGEVVGSGMEGTVVDVGGGLVAKIWHRRTAGELEVLRTFYEAVAGAGLPFEAPRIEQILSTNGQWATIEVRLSGEPLRGDSFGEAEIACVTGVLAALAATRGTPSMALLPVLEGEGPFTVDVPFGHALAALVERRTERFRGPLSRRVPDVDRLALAVPEGLRSLPTVEPALIHGDLIPANILVGAGGRPTSLLDFGFLTSVGDPAFDAAIAASIFDMYGPDARERETALDAAVRERFGYDAQRLDLYRAAYALSTSNCYSASGSDGHFEWCARILERPSVLAAMDQPASPRPSSTVL